MNMTSLLLRMCLSGSSSLHQFVARQMNKFLSLHFYLNIINKTRNRKKQKQKKNRIKKIEKNQLENKEMKRTDETHAFNFINMELHICLYKRKEKRRNERPIIRHS